MFPRRYKHVKKIENADAVYNDSTFEFFTLKSNPEKLLLISTGEES